LPTSGHRDVFGNPAQDFPIRLRRPLAPAHAPNQ
jgi:hypothetical protein